MLFLAMALAAPPVPENVLSKAVPPVPAVVAPTRAKAPEPLKPRAFTVPAASVGMLASAVPVTVVENHETPLVWVRLSFRSGALLDPPGKEGLAQATLAMMNEGAGELDSEAFSRAQRELGSSVSAGAGTDGATIVAQSLTRNLPQTLDLLTLMLEEPSFPLEEWALLQKQMLDGVAWRRSDPQSIADFTLNRVLFGDSYRGRAPTEASIQSITTRDMKRWAKRWLVPQLAAVFVGGDTTLAEVQPLLDARIGDWKARSRPFTPTIPVTSPTGSTLTVVDKPGAAQSVILAARVTGRPTDPEYGSLLLANAAVGGMFTSRLNMNLREEKGYTYGARSTLGYDLAGTTWTLSTPVQTAVTGPALREILSELAAPDHGEPLLLAEIEQARGSLLNSYPLKFEGPDWLLGQHEAVWRYGLGPGWLDGYTSRLTSVTAVTAQGAWSTRIGTQGLRFVVVGDLATIGADLPALGMQVEHRDVDGNVLPATAPPPATP